MIYDILCRDFNNQEFVLKYDPLKCTIYDETGREVFPKSLHIDPKPPQRNNFNGMQFDSIRLLIGMKCNYNCKYCAEGTNGDRINNSNFNSISPNDVDKFLKNLDKWGIKQPKLLDFRGGEPGVYIKLLEKLIPALRKRWPDTVFQTLTNGSLITERFAQLLLDNQVNLIISHDGNGQCERGPDPLDDPKKLKIIKSLYERMMANRWSKRPPLKFHVTINKVAIDPAAAVQHIRSRMGYQVTVDWHVLGGQGNGLTYRISDESLQQMAQNMLNAALADKACISNDTDIHVQNIIKTFIRDDYGAGIPPFCSATNINALTMDLNGHVFRCQNFADEKDVVGDFNDPQTLKPIHWVDFRDREVCQHCPFPTVCLGSCPLFEYGNFFNETCRYKFWFIMGYFCAAIIRTLGLIPYKIVGTIYRPKYSLIDVHHPVYDVVDHIDLPQPQPTVIEKINNLPNYPML